MANTPSCPVFRPPLAGRRLRLATAWLTGCSGCHMSLLDLDDGLLELVRRVEIVYSPIASDCKIYPEAVDVCLVEGAVATTDNLALAHLLRQRTAVVVAFGDCAVTSNVPGLRNLCGDRRWVGSTASGEDHDPWGEPPPLGRGSAAAALDRAVRQLADAGSGPPVAAGPLPALLEPVLPLHAVIAVDLQLPGCPPPADRIGRLLEALLRGERPQLQPADLRFG